MIKTESIVSNDRKCWLCGTEKDLHQHHIFYGTGNRSLSEKYGCWVYLCARHHNMSDYSVHIDRGLDEELKKVTQMILERNGWTRDDFIKTFGRSYCYD